MRRIISTVFVLICCATITFGQTKHDIKISGGFTYAFTNGFVGDVYKNTSHGFQGPENVSKEGTNKSRAMPGLNLALSYSVSNNFSAIIEVSGYKSSRSNVLFPGTTWVRGIENPTNILIIPGINTSFTGGSYYNFLAGAEYRDAKSGNKWSPFAHLLLGMGFERSNYDGRYDEFTRIRGGKNYVSDSGFEADLGGGLDLAITHSLDIRIIQIDYNPFFPMKHNVLTIGDQRDPLNSGSTYYSYNTISVDRKVQNNFRVSVGVVYHLGR